MTRALPPQAQEFQADAAIALVHQADWDGLASYLDACTDLPRDVDALVARMAPDPSDAWLRLAWNHHAHQRHAEAEAAAHQALQQSKTPTQRGNACAALGWFQLAANNLDAARDILLPALADAPQHAALHWHTGNLYLRQQDPTRAAHHLTQAVQLDPSLDDAAAGLAWALHDLGDLKEATHWARQAIGHRTTPARQAQLGWLLLCQGDAQSATSLLRQSLAATPDNPTGYVHLARALAETQQAQSAYLTLGEGLARFPEDAQLLLALGWLHHDLHNHAQSIGLADRVILQQADCASAWHLRGVAAVAQSDAAAALADLMRAIELDPTNVEAAMQVALLQRAEHRTLAAAHTLAAVAQHHPAHPALCALRAQIALDLRKTDAARAAIHALLARTPDDGNLWFLLAQALQQRHRPMVAARALRRAVRLAPYHAQAWKLSAWLALESGRPDHARLAVRQWLQHAPDPQDANLQAAWILMECGDLNAASGHAERAIAHDPASSEAWRALAQIRLLEGRLDDAHIHARHALSLRPHSAAPCLRQLAWTFRAAGQLEQACTTFREAAEAAPSQPIGWHELAETLALTGERSDARAALSQALACKPPLPKSQRLHAQWLADTGPAHWDSATQICADLLRQRDGDADTSGTLMAMAAHGHAPAAALWCQLPLHLRRTSAQASLDSAQARLCQSFFSDLAQWAHREIPDDPRMAATAVYALSLRPGVPPAELGRAIRDWHRRLNTWHGPAGATPTPAPMQLPGTSRLRLAYVAGHLHRDLLAGVLAAHDPGAVDVFLCADLAGDALRGLPSFVQLLPLRGHDLAATLHANRVDVVIDTVGVGGFLGQADVLQQFARRVAPVQCAWLGSWGSAGGIYDHLLTDSVAVPQAMAGDYAEGIVYLPGGQWCWAPPVPSPDLTPPPCLTAGHITLGCPVRALRISAPTLAAWTCVLKRLPHANLVLLGEHGASALFRDAIGAAMRTAGVDVSRVRYRPHRPYRDHVRGYADIDILLDSFPANGGLCLLDALWMGVPCVTLAGHWAGERQGASVMTAIGHGEWIARDVDHYIDLVCQLAEVPHELASVRAGLRNDMAASPLLDGQRLARAIEVAAARLRDQAQAVAHATSAKERSRALAHQQLERWLEQGQHYALAAPEGDGAATVDVSVVIVLFNQAGLSRQCFAALADQRGVRFETIVVDNASSDQTSALLGRLDGARVVRNPDNRGFLHAANQGATLARGRHILFLNNDAVLHANALRHAVHRLDSDAAIGAVGGRIVLGNGTLQEAGCIAYRDGSTLGYGRGQDPQSPAFGFVRDVDFCSGAFLLVRGDLWRQLDGFDTRYAPAYYEDTDLCFRIQDAGYRVVYDPTVWLTHFEWASAVTANAATGLMEGRRTLFAQRHQRRLASRPLPHQARPHRDRALARSLPRILLIDNAVPHMAGGGGLPRARLMVHALARHHHLSIFPLWRTDEDWRSVYASVPDNVEVLLGLGAGGLEAFLQERAGAYDFLLVSRPPNMAFVDSLWNRRPDLFAGLRLVYDAEAVFAMRDIGSADLRGCPLPATKAVQLVQDELKLVHRAETVLCVSASEAALFRSAGARRVAQLAHAMPTRTNTPRWAERAHLLFVGAIHPNTPNEDSLLWFYEHVMPILRGLEHDSIHINIVGDCTSGKVAALDGADVHLIGRVDELRPWYDRHRLFIAPTRYGAGVPAKVIEAACNGIPVVATPLLADQLGWRTGVDLATGGDASTFAQALIALYQDPARWTAMCHDMADTTRREYDPDTFQRTLDAVFAPVDAALNSPAHPLTGALPS